MHVMVLREKVISSETFKKIRRIQIMTSHMVTDVFAGHYQSVFRGKGMEFEEVREYQPGDDIRSIDWNVTARMGHLFTKRFVEERELTVMFLIDLSPSCHFGTRRQLKRQLAAEVCAILSFAAAKNNDKVGLILFTDRVEKFVPPSKGAHHVLRVIRDALSFEPVGRGTDIPLILEYLNRVSRRRAVMFILSDFHASQLKKPLSIASKRHDIVAMTLIDPVELRMPDTGILQIDDPETGESFLVDTSDDQWRTAYEEKARKRVEERKRLFDSIPIDHIDIRTDTPCLPILIKFFEMRKRRFSR